MKISIDFDGTLWQHQDFFRAFMIAMQKDGHEVGMLTGHHMKTKSDDFNLMKARGFPAPDFFIGRPDGGTIHGGSFKPRMIEKHNIDYHFDDCDYSQPHCVELMGDHPRVLRTWNEKPRGSHVNKPELPASLPPVFPPGSEKDLNNAI